MYFILQYLTLFESRYTFKPVKFQLIFLCVAHDNKLGMP